MVFEKVCKKFKELKVEPKVVKEVPINTGLTEHRYPSKGAL